MGKVQLKRQASDFTITFDGGSKCNGKQDAEAYGSFLIQGKDSEIPIVLASKIQFQRGMTNNEAEYESLIRALRRLEELVIKAGDHPETKVVTVFGDSRLVLFQVTGRWKCKAWNLEEPLGICRELVADFKEVRLLWKPRKEIELVLGH